MLAKSLAIFVHTGAVPDLDFSAGGPVQYTSL